MERAGVNKIVGKETEPPPEARLENIFVIYE